MRGFAAGFFPDSSHSLAHPPHPVWGLALESFLGVFRVILGGLCDIIEVLEPSWRLWAVGWGQRRADGGSYVLF